MPLPLELRALHRLTRALRRERERRWEVLDACREEGGFRLCGAEEEEEEEEEGVCLGTECRARTKTERVLSLVESMALQELETLDQVCASCCCFPAAKPPDAAKPTDKFCPCLAQSSREAKVVVSLSAVADREHAKA
eukprot:3566617-Rhodomonas_salina.2